MTIPRALFDRVVATLESHGEHTYTCRALLKWTGTDDLAVDDPACDCDLTEVLVAARAVTA